jgi:hypothetical protein
MKKTYEEDRTTVFEEDENYVPPPSKVAVIEIGCNRWLRGRMWPNRPYITMDIVVARTPEEAAEAPGAHTPSAEGGEHVCLIGLSNRLDLDTLVSLLKPKW